MCGGSGNYLNWTRSEFEPSERERPLQRYSGGGPGRFERACTRSQAACLPVSKAHDEQSNLGVHLHILLPVVDDCTRPSAAILSRTTWTARSNGLSAAPGIQCRPATDGISDRILVSDDSVEVHVHVGFAMMMYREPVRASIEGSIDEYIA
jgi:hypothetical protein